MLDAPTQTVLLDIVRRSGQSLLQYVHDSFPWITPQEQDALAILQKIIREERDAAAGVVRLLQHHHVTMPPFGTYPASYTGINYVSLDYLLPILINGERRDIDELTVDLARVTDIDAHDAVQHFLEMKRRHQKALETLAATPREPVLP